MVTNEINEQIELNTKSPLIVPGHLDAVKTIIEKGAMVDRENKNSETALMWAASMGHTDCVSYLIKKHGDVNYIDRNNDSPLIWAASHGI